MSQRKKINWLLLLQAWDILWVVIGHAPHYIMYEEPEYAHFLRDIARPVRMPLFMLISGFLFYMTRISKSENWDYLSVIKEKWLRIGIPFINISIIAYIFKCLIGHDRDYHFGFETFLTLFITPSEGPAAMLWFSMTIFLFFLLYHIWKLSTKHYVYEIILLISLYILHVTGVDINIFCIGNCAKYAVWFYLGILVCKYKTYQYIEKTGVTFLLIGLIVSLVGAFYDVRDLITVGGITLSCGLCIVWDKKIPYIFKSFRAYTYQIFLISCFAQIGIKNITRYLELHYFSVYIISILLGLYVPVLLSIMAKKLNNRFILLSLGLK